MRQKDSWLSVLLLSQCCHKIVSLYHKLVFLLARVLDVVSQSILRFFAARKALEKNLSNVHMTSVQNFP